METEKSAADVLYGGPSPTPSPAATSILGGVLQKNSVQTEIAAATDDHSQAEQTWATPPLYDGNGDGGDPLDNYNPVTQALFNQIDYEGRFNRDDALVAESTEAREQVNQLLVDFQVGQGAAREMMATVSQYRGTPLSDAAYDSTWETTLHGLKEKYGSDAKKMLGGAERVIADIEKRVPAAKGYMAAGLNVNAQFIGRCIEVAKRKGYI